MEVSDGEREQADIARLRWLDEGIHEIDLWCEHIGRRVREQIPFQEIGSSGFIAESEVFFSICVVMNRLAQIWMRRSGHIPEQTFISWLTRQSGWPSFVSEAFWACIRNPTMHLGRPMLLANHGRTVDHGRPLFADYNGHWEYDPFLLHGAYPSRPDLPADEQRFRKQGLGWQSELGKYFDAPNFEFPNDSVVVRFFMPGILLTLDRIRSKGIERLRRATYQEFWKLAEVMAVTGVFLAPGYSAPDHLEVLDLSSDWPDVDENQPNL